MSNALPHSRSTRDGRVRSVPRQVGTEVAGTAPVSAAPEGGYFRSHALRLVTLGYDPVPIEPGTKRPATKDWLERDFGEEKTLRRAFSGHGLGVKTGRPNADGHAVVGLDIDVLDPVVAAKLVAWCRENVGDAPLRVGQAPKAMLVFRTGKPFRKKRSRTFRSPDGEQAVEVLGTGQQFLAYAIHPVTGQPYTWDGRELVNTEIAALPPITEQQALDFIAHFESIVPTDWVSVTHDQAARTGAERHKTAETPYAPIWKLRIALDSILIPPGDPYDPWREIGMALYHATDGDTDGLALWHEWSRKGNRYEPDALDSRWKGFGAKSDGAYLSAATIFHRADKADPSWRDRAREHERIERERTVQRLVDRMAVAEASFDEVRADGVNVGDNDALTPLITTTPREWVGKPMPQRKWIVPGLIPDRNVTDLSGDGGLGKSLLAMQLGVAMATGGTWLGHKTIEGGGGVIYFSAEDELDEIQRRTVAIAESKGLSLAELDNLHVVDLTTGMDTELVVPDRDNRQSIVTTSQFARVKAVIVTLRPKLVVLDTRADMFGGNEIDRAQVRKFIRLLRELCLSYDLAILVLSHPSRTGLATGDGQSGSTGWGNSVRSRLYLKRHDSDRDLRVLSSAKANYGPMATDIVLRWRDEVFVVEGAVGGTPPDRAEQDRRVETRVLELLREFESQGRHVNPAAGPNYAPKRFAAADGLTSKEQFRAAIERLFRLGKLAVVKAGRVSKLVEVEAAVGAKLRELDTQEEAIHGKN